MVAVRSEPVATDRLKLWRRDPVCFCFDVFPKDQVPNEGQQEILWGIQKNRETVAKAYRGWGKSRAAAYAAHHWNACFCGLTMTLSPVWTQGLESIWMEIRTLWNVSILPRLFDKAECLTSELKMHPLIPKWRITSAVAHNVDTIEGRHSAKGLPTLVIADESKNIGDAFRLSCEGMLTNPESRFFGISTPGIPFGWFYNAWASQRSTYKQFSYRADESPDPAVRAQALKIAADVGETDPTYRQQWLAEFAGADEGTIIPLSLLEPACRRQFDFDPSWRKVISIDPAGRGIAKSVLTYIWGPVLLAQEAWQGWDPILSEKRIADRIRFPETRTIPGTAAMGLPDLVIIDEGGLGQGTVSHTRANIEGTEIPVVGYVSQATARNHDRFFNRKAEDVYALRDRFRENANVVAAAQRELQQQLAMLRDPTPEQEADLRRQSEAWLRRQPGISIPRMQALLGQIAAWTAGVSPSGKTRVIDPDPSPDYADSGMMGFSVDRISMPLVPHKGLRQVV